MPATPPCLPLPEAPLFCYQIAIFKSLPAWLEAGEAGEGGTVRKYSYGPGSRPSSFRAEFTPGKDRTGETRYTVCVDALTQWIKNHGWNDDPEFGAAQLLAMPEEDLHPVLATWRENAKQWLSEKQLADYMTGGSLKATAKRLSLKRDNAEKMMTAGFDPLKQVPWRPEIDILLPIVAGYFHKNGEHMNRKSLVDRMNLHPHYRNRHSKWTSKEIVNLLKALDLHWIPSTI